MGIKSLITGQSATKYPGAIWRPSSISHPKRSQTLGVVIHWTAGSKPGDIVTLDGPNVDVQLYVTKAGEVYQFLDLDSEAWHGFYTANHYCIGIETEGRGEPWTAPQLAKMGEVGAYLSKLYNIPVRHVDPSGHDYDTFRGFFGHRDLSIGGERVDGNDHTDTVPDGTGWDTFLAAVKKAAGTVPSDPIDYSKLPYDGSMRLALAGKLYAGWRQAVPAIKWVAKNGAKDPKAVITYRGPKADKAARWDGPRDVTNVCKSLVKTYGL